METLAHVPGRTVAPCAAKSSPDGCSANALDNQPAEPAETAPKYCNDWVQRSIKQLSGRGVTTHRAAAKAARAVEVAEMVKDVSEGTFVAINCGRDEAGFCYWLGKAVKAPYKAKHDWTDHCGTTIKKGDYVIDLVYWDRPSTGDPLLFEDEAKKATVHAELVLHANVAPAPAADDRVRVSEAVVAEIEAEHELFRNT